MWTKFKEAEAACSLLHSYLRGKGQRWDQGLAKLLHREVFPTEITPPTYVIYCL